MEEEEEDKLRVKIIKEAKSFDKTKHDSDMERVSCEMSELNHYALF